MPQLHLLSVPWRGESGARGFSPLPEKCLSHFGFFLRYAVIPILEIHYSQTKTRYQSQYLLFVGLNMSWSTNKIVRCCLWSLDSNQSSIICESLSLFCRSTAPKHTACCFHYVINYMWAAVLLDRTGALNWTYILTEAHNFLTCREPEHFWDVAQSTVWLTRFTFKTSADPGCP